jgi:amino acid adenylation domain-containing protein
MNRVDERFMIVAARQPDAVAVQDGGTYLTYGELDRRADRLARHLSRRGAGPDALVALFMDRCADMVVAMLAVVRAGAAYLPIDPALPAARVRFYLCDVGAPPVLTLRHWRERLPSVATDVLCLDDDLPAADPLPPRRNATGEEVAYVMYTSGSTGRPNGSRIPHRAIVRLVCDTDYVHIGPDDRVGHGTNVGFDPATFEVWGALLNGARLVVLPQERVLDPPALAADLRGHGITVLWLTAGIFHAVAAAEPGAFAGLTDLLVGGEQVDAHWVRRVLATGPPRRLLNAYGPTETTAFAAWHLVREVPAGARSVPIGGPIAGTRLSVLDDDLRPVPPGATGELSIGGAGVAHGYHDRPALTAARFVPDPSGAPGDRMFRTGDLVRRLPDGALEFLGRRDRQVKLRGVRVEPGEIEAALHALPGVRQCLVVSRDKPGGGQWLVAYVVPEPTPDDAAAVQRWRELYDDVIYDRIAESAPPGEPTFNLASWVSSYTGLPLPPEQMREQVDQTVARLRALQPRRVLDIGCGTGLLLFRVAPYCAEYVATDLSAVAVRHLEAQLAGHTPALGHVRVLQRPADDFTGLAPGSFDAVVLSSVAQHFPRADYLLRVLAGAATVVREGGWVYVGDVRSLPLLEAFHVSVALHRMPDDTPTTELRRRVQQAVRQEQELVLDPRFFTALPSWDPRFGAVHVRLKRGRYGNELTRFRYDVLLRVGDPPPTVTEERGVRGVPNARVLEAVEAARLLADDPPVTAGQVRAEAARRAAARGVDPETLWRQGERLGWAVEAGWSADGDPATFDAVFHDRAHGPAPAVHTGSADPRAYASSPRLPSAPGELVSGLRRALRERLPDALIPGAFVVLDRLPLTPNGKVDHSALPPPVAAPPGVRVPARGGTEQTVVRAFARALGAERVGVTDNFFEVGGTSLSAAQVAAQLRRDLGADVSVVRLFDTPTARGLAAALDAHARPEPPADPAWARGQARRRGVRGPVSGSPP